MLERVNQHWETGVISLVPPFWGKPRIASLLGAFLDRCQVIEDELWAMLERRDLATADLVGLVVLGKIVGQPRFGFATEDYRKLIEARGRANRSQGRSGDLLAVLNVIFGSGSYSRFTPGGATAIIQVESQVTATDVRLAEQVVGDTVPAAVAVLLLTQQASTVDTDWIPDSSVSPGTVGATPLWSAGVL